MDFQIATIHKFIEALPPPAFRFATMGTAELKGSQLCFDFPCLEPWSGFVCSRDALKEAAQRLAIAEICWRFSTVIHPVEWHLGELVGVLPTAGNTLYLVGQCDCGIGFLEQFSVESKVINPNETLIEIYRRTDDKTFVKLN